MRFQTMASEAGEARRRAARGNASGSAVQLSETPIVCTVEHFYTLRLTATDRVEHDRQDSLEFLHLLVMGPTTD